MKKLINIVIPVLILSLCLFGCGKNNTEENVTTTDVQIGQTEASTTTPNAPISDSTQNQQEDIGGGDILQDKYRLCYYHVPYHFTLLVDREEFDKWKEEIYLVYPNETNEMVMKSFIQDFNISREDFDKANHDRALDFSQENQEVPVMNPKDYVNQEMWEVFNGDIIYTFDDEIINEYYLSHSYPFVFESEYEDAVRSGTYKTQTTDFYFPELDSHSCVSLRGFEYPEEVTVAPTEAITTVKAEDATEE